MSTERAFTAARAEAKAAVTVAAVGAPAEHIVANDGEVVTELIVVGVERSDGEEHVLRVADEGVAVFVLGLDVSLHGVSCTLSCGGVGAVLRPRRRARERKFVVRGLPVEACARQCLRAVGDVGGRAWVRTRLAG